MQQAEIRQAKSSEVESNNERPIENQENSSSVTDSSSEIAINSDSIKNDEDNKISSRLSHAEKVRQQ